MVGQPTQASPDGPAGGASGAPASGAGTAPDRRPSAPSRCRRRARSSSRPSPRARAGSFGNQVEVTSSDYNPTLRRPGPDRAEFSLQVIHRPRGVGAIPPPGGPYIMAADLKRAGAARTAVVLYRPSMGFKDITKGFMQWVDGKSSDCPKLK